METPGDRLRRIRELAGYPTAAAFVKAHPSVCAETTQRAREADTRGLTPRVAERYAAIFRRKGATRWVTATWLLYGTGSSEYVGPPMSETELAQLTVATLGRRWIYVRGHVRADEWREAMEWPQDDWYAISPLEDDRFPGVGRYGLEVRGSSMNRCYPDGATIICVRFADIGRGPKSGERVVCRRRNAHGLVEATVKEFRFDEDGQPWLWPRSNHPDFQTPFRLPSPSWQPDTEEERFEVVALVVGSVRKE